jgi:Delta6-protoilludene synthase
MTLLSSDECRIGSDVTIFFFLFDECSDRADVKGARVLADIVMDAFRNPTKPRPTGEWIGGEIARQLWENAVRTATLTSQKRFIEMCDLFTTAVVQQAKDRDDHNIRQVDEYFEVRRDTIGLKHSFVINEIPLNIPNDVMENDVIKAIHTASLDMIIIDNDILSWNVE